MANASPTPQNILLILTDQHRYDIVGVNGSKLCQSPNLDRLASQGVNYSKAYSVCPLCTPARASIYTGASPSRHGMLTNAMLNTPNGGAISSEMPTLAERLSQKGYDCRFAGKWHAGSRLPTECGFSGMDIKGYGSATDATEYHAYLKRHSLELPTIKPIGGGWAHQLTLAGVMSGPVEASVPYFLADYSIGQLDELASNGQPFFQAINFWGPHAPYVPSEPYASMYDPKDIEPWDNFEDTFKNKPPIYRRYRDAFIGEGRSPRSWEEVATWAALYYGFATQIDHQIGRIIDHLDRSGLGDNTAIIFSTDHGDLTGAHGGMHDKNAILVEELMHLPMITRMPNQVNPGSTCNEYVSNMDIPATIMQLAGQSVPAEFDSRSFVDLMNAKDAPVNWPDFAAAEFFGNHFAYECRMVVHKDFKYIFHPGAFDELYDLNNDPWEMTNLIDQPEYKSMLDDCKRRMLQWIKDHNADLCVACGLFHDREPWSTEIATGYTPNSQNDLRTSPTRLIGDA